MKTIDSSKITWDIWPPDADDDWTQIYCPDGEGIIQVVVYSDRIELLDQLELCNTWTPDSDIDLILEAAQHYLQSAYFDIFTRIKK
jgi:hypothetical protein